MNEEQNKDEEISLIDLIVVVLKHRRLILCVTLVGALVSGIYFAYTYTHRPAAQPQAAEDPAHPLNADIEGRIGLLYNPQAPTGVLRDGLYASIFQADLFYSALRDSGLEYLELEGHQASLIDEKERSEALYLIDKRLLNNQNIQRRGMPYEEYKLQIINRGHYYAEVVYRGSDPEQIRAFLGALLKSANRMMRERYAEGVRYWENYYDNIVSKNPAQVWDPTNQGYYDFTKRFSAGEGELIVEAYPSFVAANPGVTPAPAPVLRVRQIGARSLLIVAGGFFAGIFLAFSVNAARNISIDDGVKAKLREALKKPGAG